MRSVTVPKFLFLSHIHTDDVKARNGCSPKTIVVRVEPLMCCRPILFTWLDHIYCWKWPCCVHMVYYICTVSCCTLTSTGFTQLQNVCIFSCIYISLLYLFTYLCAFFLINCAAIFNCYLLICVFNAPVRNFISRRTDRVLSVPHIGSITTRFVFPERWVFSQ